MNSDTRISRTMTRSRHSRARPMPGAHDDARDDERDPRHPEVVQRVFARRDRAPGPPPPRASAQVNSMRAPPKGDPGPTLPGRGQRRGSDSRPRPYAPRRFSPRRGRACKHGRDGRPARGRPPPRIAGRSRASAIGSCSGWIPGPLRHGITLFVRPRVRRVRRHSELPAFKGAFLAEPAGPGQHLWLLAGFALEAGALVAYGRLTSPCCPEDGPSFSKVLRIDLSTPRGEPRDPGRHRRAEPASATGSSPRTASAAPMPVSPSPPRESGPPSC